MTTLQVAASSHPHDPEVSQTSVWRELGPGASGQYFPIGALVALVVGILAMSADIMLAKSLFDHVVNESAGVSLVIALAVAGASGLTAISAGGAFKARKRGAGIGLVVAWLSIGLGVAGLRGATGLFMDDPDGHTKHIIVGVVMLLIYLAAGFDVIVSAMKLADPRYMALGFSNLQSSWGTRRLARLQAQYERTLEVMDRIKRDIARLDGEVQVENELLDSYEQELKARARLRHILHLRDPASASGYRSETWPSEQKA